MKHQAKYYPSIKADTAYLDTYVTSDDRFALIAIAGHHILTGQPMNAQIYLPARDLRILATRLIEEADYLDEAAADRAPEDASEREGA